MPLGTYAELKDSLTNQSSSWTKRDDVLTLADDFIDLTESRMYSYGVAPLRIREMETSGTTTTSTTLRTLALPTRFLELRRFQINITNADPVKLEYVTPLAMKVYSQTGMPRFFTVEGTFVFDRISDTAYTVEYHYYQRLTALDSTNTTNAILTNYPGIYLYGCLWACAEWAMQDERAEMYRQKFSNEIAMANARDVGGRYGPSPVISKQGYVP